MRILREGDPKTRRRSKGETQYGVGHDSLELRYAVIRDDDQSEELRFFVALRSRLCRYGGTEIRLREHGRTATEGRVGGLNPPPTAATPMQANCQPRLIGLCAC